MFNSLQQLSVKPRAKEDHRLAKVDNRTKTIGEDGKLYILTDKEDYEKYKWDNNTPNQVEKKFISDLRNSFNSSHVNQPMNLMTSRILPSSKPRGEKYDFEHENFTDQSVLYKDKSSKQLSKSPQKSDVRYRSSLNVLQKKYEENLVVINKIFHEKLVLETKMIRIENQLKTNHLANQKENKCNSEYNENFDLDQELLEKCKDSSGMTAIQAADIFKDKKDIIDESPNLTEDVYGYSNINPVNLSMPKQHPSDDIDLLDSQRSRSTSRRPLSSVRSLSTSSARGLLQRPFTPQPHQRPRPLSAGSEGFSRVKGLSAHLRADQDRYVQRKRACDYRADKEIIDQKQHEEKLRQRQLRASMKGKEFAEMMKRDLLFQEAKQKRLQRVMQEIQNDMKTQHDGRLRHAFSNTTTPSQAGCDKAFPVQTRSWKEIKEMEELDRQSRLQQRRLQVEAMVEPFSCAVTKNKVAVNESLIRTRNLCGYEKDRFENEKRREKMEVALDRLAMSSPQLVASMKQREDEAAARWRSNDERRQQREQQLEQQRKEVDRRRLDMAMKARIPDNAAKLTKAAAERLKLVKRRLDEEKMAEERKQQQLLKKEQRIREMSAVLKTTISLNEQDRKSRHGGYVELRSTEQVIAAQKADLQHISLREALKKNKSRIEKSLNGRPTLIERQARSQAAGAAGIEALEKVAAAVAAVAGEAKGTSGAYEDDMFDDDEMLVLRAKAAAP